MIQRFTKGPRHFIDKLNRMAAEIDRMRGFIGDGYVQITDTGSRVAGLAKNSLIPHIPRPRGIASTSSGLLAWYQFNGNASDSSSGGHDGTFVGGMTAPYNVGEFDGSDDYINCGDDFLGTGALTIMAWIRPTAFGTFPNYQKTIVGNTKVRFETYGSGDKLRFSSDGTTLVYSAASSITLHEWQHVAVTRDANGAANFYVNGVLSGTADQASGTPIAPAAGVGVLISYPTATVFAGAMDDVRIYNSVKPVYQIRQAMDERERGYFHTNQIIGPIRIAYCKENAPADATIDCYLDTDATGEEVTVTCHIAQGGTALNAAAPRLADGDIIMVMNVEGTWRCLTTFDIDEECECYST